ncbi:MAG: TrmH family RNA methyltransferase, partial [Gemmatimonadota bacterium]
SGTTSSAHLWMEVRRHPSVRAAYAALRAQGFAIVATAIGADAREPWAVDFTRPTALVLGNEQRGVSPDAAAAADLRVLIPMRGMVQSLNLSVAAGALLFEAMRQRQAAAMYDRPRLADSDRRRILETWLDRERGNSAP